MVKCHTFWVTSFTKGVKDKFCNDIALPCILIYYLELNKTNESKDVISWVKWSLSSIIRLCSTGKTYLSCELLQEIKSLGPSNLF